MSERVPPCCVSETDILYCVKHYSMFDVQDEKFLKNILPKWG